MESEVVQLQNEYSRFIPTDKQTFLRVVKRALFKLAGRNASREVRGHIALFLTIPGCIGVGWRPCPPNGVDVTIRYADDARPQFEALLSEIEQPWPEGQGRAKRPRGPRPARVQKYARIWEFVKGRYAIAEQEFQDGDRNEPEPDFDDLLKKTNEYFDGEYLVRERTFRTIIRKGKAGELG